MKANEENAWHLRYDVCSGQMINKDKSSITFSKNTRTQERRKFMDVLELT